MKASFKFMALIVVLTLMFGGCAKETALAVNTPQDAVKRLEEGNAKYINANKNPAEITGVIRKDTAQNGQEPFAVIVTCSDSRVPPEHIFSAGIGELFVIRTAGNVVNEFELGSIEYGVSHLNAKLIVVMGHSQCGAVAAAMEGHAEGHIEDIIDEINNAIANADSADEAENKNAAYTARKIYDESAIVKELVDAGEIAIIQAKYNIETGEAEINMNAGE